MFSASLCDARLLGAAVSRSWAGAGVSSGIVEDQRAYCPMSKLPEIEADTVEVPNEPGIVRVGCAFNDRKVEKVCPASKQALDDLKTKSTWSAPAKG